MFRTVRLSIIRSLFTVHSAMVYVIQVCRQFLTLFVVLVGGWFGYEIAGFALSDNLFSVRLYGVSSFAGSM